MDTFGVHTGKGDVITKPQVGAQGLRQESWAGKGVSMARRSSEDPSCSLLGLLRFTRPKLFIHKIQMGPRVVLLT